VRFAKPHGALYHASDRDAALADAVVGGVTRALGTGVTLVGPASGELARAAYRVRLAYLREGFADRGTRADRTPIPPGEPGAVVTEPSVAAARTRELVARGDVDTLCVHGDTPGAIAIARAVRGALDAEGSSR